MAGFAAKSCLELGMHKNSFFENLNGGSDKRIFLKTLFCCVYDLDKRCSFFANLPWTLHDKAIDENVFKLVRTIANNQRPQPYFTTNANEGSCANYGHRTPTTLTYRR